MNDNDPSIVQNRPDPSYQPPGAPEPLVGEVKAGAADPKQEDAVSVLANMPEEPAPMSPPAPLGEVMAGASSDDEVPPSVRGTSYDPR